MIFYYTSQGALVCDIRIKGLTHRINGWTVHNFWRDADYRREFWVAAGYYEDYECYGGHKFFIAESMSRSAAQIIVNALGGYLVDDSYIPVGRQLGTGGPFFVHRFDLYAPMSMGRLNSIDGAINVVESCGRRLGLYRIYDASGFMVMEIKISSSPR